MDTRIKYQVLVNQLLATIESPEDFVMENIDKLLNKLSHQKRKLLLHGYGSSFKTSVKMTPLQYVAYTNNLSIAELLLGKYNVDVNQVEELFPKKQISSKIKHTALGLAIQEKHIAIVKLLVEKYNANMNLTADLSPPPIHLAVYNCDLELIKYLFDHGVSVNEVWGARTSYTPASMTAVANFECLDCIKYLTEKGVDANSADQCGHTLLHHAARMGNISIIKFLLTHECSMNKDHYGLTAVHVACLYQQFKTAQYLLNKIYLRKVFSIREQKEAHKLYTASVALYNDKLHSSTEGCTYYDFLNVHKEQDKISFNTSADTDNLDLYSAMNICEDIIGIYNPYMALVIENISFHEPAQRLLWMRKKLDILMHTCPTDSIVFVLVSLGLIFCELPQIERDDRAINEVYCILENSAHYFIDVQVWDICSLKEWMTGFKSKQEFTTYDQNVQNFINILYHIFNDLPRCNSNQWIKIKSITTKFIEITENALQNGVCLKSPINILYTLKEWRKPVLNNTADKIYNITKLLMDCGSNINQQDNNGNTALHAFVHMLPSESEILLSCGYFLIHHGAHRDARNNDGLTPYDFYKVQILHFGSLHNKTVYMDIFQDNNPLLLKCICSRVIRKYMIQYRSRLPSHIIPYVEIH